MAKRISIVGAGPGDRAFLTLGGLAAIETAGLLIAAPRLLEAFPEAACEKRACVCVEEIARHIRESGQESICVLVSGDAGFYSAAKKLRPLLSGCEAETIPGISSLQYLCAKLRIPWEDIPSISAHGRQVNVAAHAARHARVFFLTGGEMTAQTLCVALVACGMGDAKVTVGSRLSYPDESIVTDSAANLAARSFDPLNAVLVERAAPPRWGWATGGIPDGLFLRGNVPMTKAEVRCVAVAKLRVGPGDVIYDIGAGTGSVSVELALAGGRVYAVERDGEALELLTRNRDAFGAHNIQLVPGEAPKALEHLPSPAAMFVGGSGGRLGEILRAALDKNPGVRVAITAVSLETPGQAVRLLEELKFRDIDVAQVSVSRGKAMGGHWLMQAQNPIAIISGQGAGA